MAIPALVERGQIVEGLADIGMTRRQRSFAQRQRALEQRFGLGIARLALVERGKIGQLGRHVDGIEPGCLFHDGKRALVDRLGHTVLAETAIDLRKVVQRAREIAVGRPFLEGAHHRLRQRQSFDVFSGAFKPDDLAALRRQILGSGGCTERKDKAKTAGEDQAGQRQSIP
jgi:hypothetical protein